MSWKGREPGSPKASQATDLSLFLPENVDLTKQENFTLMNRFFPEFGQNISIFGVV